MKFQMMNSLANMNKLWENFHFMKKCFILILSLFCVLELFAISYNDNEYQRKSRAYAELSEKALNEGDYEASLNYAHLAEENARLSAEFIQKMLARVECEQWMNKARTRYIWAKNNKAESLYPALFAEATESLNAGDKAFKNEDYDVATSCAKKVLSALSDVTGNEGGFVTLPSTYKVRTWRGERDCLWTIAELIGVYGDPLLWQKLYTANKDKLPNINNPDLVMIGTVLVIPSVKGEKREGLYDHNANYKKLE